MLGKKAIGHDELIGKYRRHICQAAASVAGSREKPLIRLDNNKEMARPGKSKPASRLEAHLARS